MIGLMVMPITDEIDDTQHDIVPFDSSGGLGLFSLFPPNIPGSSQVSIFPGASGGQPPLALYECQGTSGTGSGLSEYGARGHDSTVRR